MSSGVEVAKRCQELDRLSPSEVRAFMDSFDVVLADCDGVLWKGSDEIPGSAETIRMMRDMLTQVELTKRD